MNLKMTVLAVTTGLVFLLFVLHLVRQKRFSEEYAFLWLVTAGVFLFLIISKSARLFLTGLIGAKEPGSMFFFFSVVFLVLNALYSSSRMSAQANQIRDLSRAIALLRNELASKNAGISPAASEDESAAE